MAVLCANADEHDSIAGRQKPDSVNDADFQYGPGALGLLDDCGQDLLGHPRVMLEPHPLAARRVKFANSADKRDHRTGLGVTTELLVEFGLIEIRGLNPNVGRHKLIRCVFDGIVTELRPGGETEALAIVFKNRIMRGLNRICAVSASYRSLW